MAAGRDASDPPRPVFVLRGHTAEVSAARFDPSGTRLLTGDAGGELRLWDLEMRRPLATLARAHDGRVLGAHADAAGAVAAQGRDGCVRVWEAGLDRRAPSLELRTGCFNFCRFDLLAREGEPPRKWLVALPGDDADDVCVWELGSGARAFQLRRQPTGSADAPRVGMCTSIAFESAGAAPRLVAGLEDGAICLWDARAPAAAVQTCRGAHAEPVLCIATAPRAALALSGSADRRICALSIGARAAEPAAVDGRVAATTAAAAGAPPTGIGVAHTFDLPVTDDSMDTGGINDLAVRRDGRLFASGGWDRRVRVFEFGKRWRPLAVLRHHSGAVNAVDFSPCGTWLASASADKTVALWSVFAPRRAERSARTVRESPGARPASPEVGVALDVVDGVDGKSG
ncbi:hypothetical protein KFE25_010735 [Diacronema lutheri]|uniref:Guanine nucleotide-binding protein subunit beta-like protein n=1 Tax=Diacronema lutheri TaxID=2081491 RepID=A0A8J5XHJ3_DIALT|nr:hypothetical protein KFE25_010735 [Diacronema lutheri]